MHFTRNCDCLHASFGSGTRVLLAESVLEAAGIWCRLEPDEGCGMVLVLRKEDWDRALTLLREKGLAAQGMLRTSFS